MRNGQTTYRVVAIKMDGTRDVNVRRAGRAMPRHHFADANRQLHQCFALIEAGIRELEPVDENVPIHDRAIVVRESVRECIEQLGYLEDAIRFRQQLP